MLWLVTGHFRGGTTFTASLFQKHGYDVQHERWGRHGICSWSAAVAFAEHVEVNWGHGAIRLNWQHPDQIVHVLRAPIDTIASALTRDWTHREQATKPGDSPLMFMRLFVNMEARNAAEMGVLMYLGWHRLIRGLGPDVAIKVEEIEKVLPFYIRSCGLPVSDRQVDVKTGAFADMSDDPEMHRRYRENRERFNADYVREQCAPHVIEGLEEFCAIYGYDPETFGWKDKEDDHGH